MELPEDLVVAGVDVVERSLLPAQREAEQALLWGRPGSALPPAEEIPLEDLSVHWLERALRRLIEAQLRQRPREIEPNPPSVLERMTEILTLLRDTWSLLFSSLTGGERRRSEIVVTLLAVLKLVRLGLSLGDYTVAALAVEMDIVSGKEELVARLHSLYNS